MPPLFSRMVIFLTSLSVFISPAYFAQAQSQTPNVSVDIQLFHDSPLLQVVLSPRQPGVITRIKLPPPSLTWSSQLSLDRQWVILLENIAQGPRLVYKRVGTVKGTVIASENDEENITFLGFDRASHYLLYVLSAFEHSIPDYRWSVNIINLESGARTTLYSQYKRVRGSGCTAGHVMTEIPSMLNMWNAEEKRLLFLTSIRFNEQDDPQSVPIGFYALDLSKFDLRKGGVFAMPSMTEFYRVNRGKDVCACEANLVGRETLSPDGSRLAFAYASYCTRSSTEPITVLDLKTGHIRQLPIDWPQEINTHGVRSLTWIADGQQLAYITAHNLFTPHENEVYLHVFDLASDTVIHKAAIDLEGKSTWMDVKVCGDTVFLMGMLKQDKSSVYRLYSAPLANPEEQTELFKAYSMGNMVCETN